MVNDYIKSRKCSWSISNVLEVALIDTAVHFHKTFWITAEREGTEIAVIVNDWKTGWMDYHADPEGHFWCSHVFYHSTNLSDNQSGTRLCKLTPETVTYSKAFHFSYLFATNNSRNWQAALVFYFPSYNIYLYFLCLSLSFYSKHTLFTSDLFLGKH